MSSLGGRRVGRFPFDYLGFPLFCGSPTFQHLRLIAVKILSQFDTWKGRSLFYAGKVCLINSVISFKFVYSFSVYKWHISLLKELNKAIKNFFWSSSILVEKLMIVGWDHCCKPQSQGDIGEKNFIIFNQALISKFTLKVLTNDSFIFAILRAWYKR